MNIVYTGASCANIVWLLLLKLFSYTAKWMFLGKSVVVNDMSLPEFEILKCGCTLREYVQGINVS